MKGEGRVYFKVMTYRKLKPDYPEFKLREKIIDDDEVCRDLPILDLIELQLTSSNFMVSSRDMLGRSLHKRADKRLQSVWM